MDGVLDEEVWRTTQPMEAFIQAVPQPGAVPSQRTRMWVAHDGRTLFVAVRAYDTEAASIVARSLQRDSDGIEADDHIALVFDPRGTHRNGFLFMVNARGAQRDALVFDGAQTLTDWDAVWESSARIDAEGWTAEIAIPLSVLNAGKDASQWRFNAARKLAARSESVRLYSAAADKDVTSLTDAGSLQGIASNGYDLGLRFRPGVRVSAVRENDRQQGSDLEASLDVFYQVTPALTAALTLNPDFADAEADEREVNLTRFELFRPEKRSFFTQDAGRFSFGGLERDAQLLLPFFSRRIGLGSDGTVRSLNAGAKLSGSAGPVEIGALAVRVDAPPAAQGERESTADIGVLRAAAGVSQHQRLGMIAVTGNPEGTPGSRLTGVDHQYRTALLGGSRTLETYAWAMETSNEGLNTGRAYGARMDYPNVGLTTNVSWQRIEDDFLPALGFVSEPGVDRATGELGWWHRTASGGDLIPELDWSVRRRLDGRERSSQLNPQVYVANAAGDFLYADVFFDRETVAEPFELLPGLIVPDGYFRGRYFELSGETSASRRWWATGVLGGGDYYNGRQSEQSVSLSWRPNEHFFLSAGADRNDIQLPDGRFVVQTRSLQLTHAGSIRSSQSVMLQWDNVSHDLGLSLRARYLFAQGRELIFSYDQRGTTSRFEQPMDNVVTLKLIWNWQR